MNSQVNWLDFCKDWNQGSTAKQLAHKYGCTTATIRAWVNMLRKKGVNLHFRVKAGEDIDVDKLNLDLQDET